MLFVSNIVIILVWLFRTTPALAEIGDLFVHTVKLGSVPFVLVFPNATWCSMMASPMFMLSKFFRFLLGMSRNGEYGRLHAIEYPEIIYYHRNCDSLHLDPKAALEKKIFWSFKFSNTVLLHKPLEVKTSYSVDYHGWAFMSATT